MPSTVLRFTVTDSTGASASVDKTITVTAPNTNGRIPGTYGQDDLLPGGAKVRGTWIVPLNGIFWTDFDNVWAAATQPRISREMDRAAQLGCNVIGITGSVASMISATTSGNTYQPITRAQYHARWDWINAQAVARGLRLNVAGQVGLANDNFASLSQLFLSDELAAWVTHINSYQNVMAIDVVDEGYLSTTAPQRQALYDRLKPLTAIPLCFSLDGARSTLTSNGTARNAIRAHTDFFNVHWYHVPAASEIEAGYWSQGETKPLLIGEYGYNANRNRSQATVNAQVAMYGAVKNADAYVGASGRRAAGCVNWSCTSYEVDHDWGVYDVDGTYQAYIGDIVKTVPKT